MELFPVDGPSPGRLAVCPRPRSAPWLEDDMAALRRAGPHPPVLALTPGEAAWARVAAGAASGTPRQRRRVERFFMPRRQC